MKIKRIKPKSLAKVCGLSYLVIGTVFASPFFLISLLIPQEGGAPIPVFFAIGIVVAIALLYGGLGYVGGFVSAWIYNFIAKKVGGIEIETE